MVKLQRTVQQESQDTGSLQLVQTQPGLVKRSTALRMACEHGFKEIYILGFDYQGHNDGKRFKLNNIFGDTRNYKKRNEEATFYGNWMNQTQRCLQDFKDVKFHRVIPEGWFKPKDIERAGNMDHLTTKEFLAKFDLQIKI